MCLTTLESKITDWQLQSNLCELRAMYPKKTATLPKFTLTSIKMALNAKHIDDNHVIPNADFNTCMKSLYKNWMDHFVEIKNINFKKLI